MDMDFPNAGFLHHHAHDAVTQLALGKPVHHIGGCLLQLALVDC
jgi:hypothetical protein